MAKLVRVETDYRFYVVELTDEQLERYNSDDDDLKDEVMEEVYDEMEFTRDKDGGTEYYIEE
jgi:aspartate/glutamate racemase|tara:strand:- start:616 stop:801 length:186 start_codon:yes stop_codon:yes gene_type:complete